MNSNLFFEMMKVLFKENDQESVKNLLEPILNTLMLAEREEAIGAKAYERSASRKGYASGFKPKKLKTSRFGELELLHPQARGLHEPFHSDLFNRYQRSEKALLTAIGEMYFSGVSTRKVAALYGNLFNTSISPQMVSKAAKEIDVFIKEWQNRPVDDYIPVLIIDAFYSKSRRDGAVKKRGVLIVSAIQANGKRRILDFLIDDTESESSYTELFDKLKARGLEKVAYIVSDAHKGLVAAVDKSFPEATWQRCRVHFMREFLKKLKKAEQPHASEMLKRIYKSKSIEEARYFTIDLEEFLENNKHPRLAESLWEDIESTLQFLSFDKLSVSTSLRKLSHSNLIERLNGEIKRRIYSIRIFPNDASLKRLVGAILLEQDEEWENGRSYIDFDKERNQRELDEPILKLEREKYIKLLAQRTGGNVNFAETC